jgi:hypothetical protein
MKYIWTIVILLLLAPTVLWSYPKMESSRFVITTSEFSAMGKYKAGDNFDTWDTLGQPTAIGAWLDQGNNSGAGWIYTISLPILWGKDRDRDGMPQAFEEMFDPAHWSLASGLDDFNPADAAIDGDGDGFYNIQEYIARTDPSDGASFFQFTDVRIISVDGMPTLVWQNPTIRITGFESEYPNYLRSLAFDVLYADWSRTSQAAGEFPSGSWFNLTGTWQLHPNGVGIPRDGLDNYFKDTTASSLANGDIRFYRLAIAGTWLQGEPIVADPEASWRYYTEIGDYRLASTLAREVMMIQRHNIPGGQTQIILGLPGNPAAKSPEDGKPGYLNWALGTGFFTAGGSASEATRFQLWQPEKSEFSIDFLDPYYGWVDQTEGQPSGRTVPGSSSFFLTSPSDYVFGACTFYSGATLKTDSYYHDIYRRHDSGPWVDAFDPDLAYYYRLTPLNYNFPVNKKFFDSFPDLAGTTNPSTPGWQALESDWIVFYNKDLSSIGGKANEPTVAIFQDHLDAGKWKYFIPFNLWMAGQAVGDELAFTPGSPAVVMQYWNPDEPSTWSAQTFEFDIPYQESVNEVKSYLQYEDN